MTQARPNGVLFYSFSPSVSGLVLELVTAKDKKEDEQHKRTTAVTTTIFSYHYVPMVTEELQSGSETRQPT